MAAQKLKGTHKHALKGGGAAFMSENTRIIDIQFARLMSDYQTFAQGALLRARLSVWHPRCAWWAITWSIQSVQPWGMSRITADRPTDLPQSWLIIGNFHIATEQLRSKYVCEREQQILTYATLKLHLRHLIGQKGVKQFPYIGVSKQTHGL